MGASPSSRCGYTYPEDHEVEDSPAHQNCCYRETLVDTDRCAWHADPNETDEKTVNALQAANTPLDIRKQNSRFAELLDGANLSGIELGDSISFENVALRNVNLQNADLTYATLEGANLTGANLFDATLTHAILHRADLTEASLGAATLTNADLQYAAFINAKLQAANLTNADLGGASLKEATLFDADLTEAYLGGATLTNAYLGGATLTNADLSHTTLINTNLMGADLTDTIIISSVAQWADMSRAMAVNADFTETDLLGVNFESADLRNSVFDRATLLEARLYDAKLRGVSINDQTVFGECTVYEREADPCESSYSADNETAMPMDHPYPDQADQGVFSQSINTVKREGKRFRAHRALDSKDRRKASNQLSKAISVYRSRQRLHRENSQPEDIETPYIQEKSCRRKRSFVQEQWGQWLKRAVFRWVMLYGESPARVVLTSIAVIVFFAALYPLFGGVHIESAAATHTFFDPHVYIGIDSSILETITASLYFSAVTFSTLGYGGIQPATSATQFLASVQSLLGGILIALLVAVFARRALR